MYPQEETQIAGNGLRYTSKESGSPFQGLGAAGETMSCIHCGHHRPRRNGVFKRYLNSMLFLCSDCKPARPKQPAAITRSN